MINNSCDDLFASHVGNALFKKIAFGTYWKAARFCIHFHAKIGWEVIFLWTTGF